MKCTIRKFKESDRDFITKSVLFSFMNGSKEVQKINRDSYMQSHNKTINSILDNGDCLCACDPLDEDLIYGFVIYEHGALMDILHYIYVRKPFRRNRFAAELLSKIYSKRSLVYTHLTEEFRAARLKRSWEKVIYDPYLRIMK